MQVKISFIQIALWNLPALLLKEIHIKFTRHFSELETTIDEETDTPEGSDGADEVVDGDLDVSLN